jgi:uncharacterized protein
MRAMPRCLLLLPLVGVVQSASFDCAKATTKIEQLVCADAALSAQDEVLAATYRQAVSLTKPGDTEPKASQRAWLKQRNACGDAACIAAAYRTRIAELEDAIGQDLNAEAIAGTYVRRDDNFSEERSPAEITIRTLPDGHVDVLGDASWIGDAETGNINIGTLEGKYELRAGRVDYRDGDDEWSCVLTLRFTRDALDIHEPKPTCGGMNVSFGGHYVRR